MCENFHECSLSSDAPKKSLGFAANSDVRNPSTPPLPPSRGDFAYQEIRVNQSNHPFIQ